MRAGGHWWHSRSAGHYVAFGDMSYPAHITALLRKNLTRIFLESTLTAPDFYLTDHGGIPGNPKVTWQKIGFDRLRGLRFSDNVIAVARKAHRAPATLT